MTPYDRFKQLPSAQQDAILDKHRYINVEDTGWWDFDEELFTADMKHIGVDVDKIYFTGFCSHGDGACFEGQVVDWPAYLESIGYTDPVLLEHAAANWSFKVHHYGRYYHENCVRSTAVELPLPADEEDWWFCETYCSYEADSLREAAFMATLSQYSRKDFEDEIMEGLRGHMRDLYSRLEDTHDALTEDEAVLETLDCHGILLEELEELEREMESEE